MTSYSSTPENEAPYPPPVVINREEKLVRERFWRKLRRLVGHIPFAEDLAAAYFCAVDARTPVRVRAVLLGALAYFVLPADLIPDWLAGLGFTDDASVLTLAMGIVSGHVRERHRARAHAALLRPEPQPDED